MVSDGVLLLSLYKLDECGPSSGVRINEMNVGPTKDSMSRSEET